MKRIGLTASEEKSFENVDDGQTDGRRTDGRRIPLYTKSSPMSLQFYLDKLCFSACDFFVLILCVNGGFHEFTDC